MLYKLLYELRDFWFGFNVFRYITVRSVLASITALLITILLGPLVIKKLSQLKIRQSVRSQKECPQLYTFHQGKEGIPTMGGIFIILAIVLSTVLWADLTNRFVLLVLFSTISAAILGFADDYLKLTKKNAKGLNLKLKLCGQIIIASFVAFTLSLDPNWSRVLEIPFFKNILIDLGLFYALFVVIVITGASNAVNLTDGLDGLAIGCVLMVAATYGAMSYVSGNIKFSNYLMIWYVPGSGELAVFCASMVGAALGFLWYNCFPANVFMGDTGALSLGAAIGTIALLIKKELLLVLVGGIFVIEAISVILQITSYRLKLKRPFLVAPLHHHLQLKGWAESKIVVRFWIIAIILALASLSTLKLR